MPADAQRARELFLHAVGKLPPEQWDGFVVEACQGDADLERQVRHLLQVHREAGSFLETPAVAGVIEELAGQACASPTQAESAGCEGEDVALDFLSPSEKPGSLGRLGHYEVQEVIGRGGMGVVLQTFDEELHRVVAIKVMAQQLATSATARKRFKREAQAVAAVIHDHIVTIHAVEEANGLPYLVMQYVGVPSLQQRLDRDGPLELQEILRIGMQTASGLAAAHAQGLVHRDIKPANILLENGVERVKVTDFGLARAVADANLTQSGVLAGTPQYMSPEQA
ncbi:MAG TPA: serine/threonine-protein kinase, partial [Gemmataceae bacterium]